jgi:hypothetical protein
MHGGVDGVLKTGDIIEVPDPRGRHILNKFDRKGIVQLNFGDNPDAKAKDAMAVWRRFWERQIIIFNQDNERRKNTQKEYAEPTKELREHAEKLGLELVGPWSIKQTDNEALRNVLNENAELKTQLAALAKQMEALTAAVTARDVPFELRSTAEKIELGKRGVESQPEIKLPETKIEDSTVETTPPPSLDYARLVAEFQKLSKDRFGEWVMVNLDRFESGEFPPAVMAMVREKWERLIKGEFPIPR